MLTVGITGGIGSGKSLVAKIFCTLGIPVYDADIAAKQLMNTHPTIKKNIIRSFGEESYKNGILDRNYLATAIFNDNEKLQQLNAIVHPVTIQDANEWFLQQQAPYAIKEAALIFESGSNKYLDYVIGVTAPLQLRIKRAMARDQITEEKVSARINNQMNEQEKMRLCDFIIENDEKKSVIGQVMDIHYQLLKKQYVKK